MRLPLFAILLLLVSVANAQEYRIQVITFTAATNVLVMKASVPAADVPKEMAKIIAAVYQHLESQKVNFLKDPFARYFKYEPPKLVEFEAGFLLEKAVKDNGEMKATTIEAGKNAMTMHVGPYDKIGGAYEALHKWMDDNGMKPNGAPWELYIDDPAKTKPEALRTLVYYPFR